MKQTKKIIAALAAATMVASCAGVVASAAEAVNAVNVSYSTVAETFTAADGTVVPAGATAVTLSIENNTGFSASDITLNATADLLGTDGLVTATNGSAYGNATVSAAQKQWISDLRTAGYAVEVCKGWEAAAAVITDYLEGRYRQQYQR